MFFQYAVRHHWVLSNPIDEVDIPSDADAERVHVLTAVEEEDYFMQAARLPDLHDVGRVMINQGMRSEEVTSLAEVDINFESGKIHVVRGKTKAAKGKHGRKDTKTTHLWKHVENRPNALK
jgi:integrase